MKEQIIIIYQATISLVIVLVITLLLNSKTEELPKREKNITVLACASYPEARCTGSSYCRACKNCSRCKHCNSGGSCGVCERKVFFSKSTKQGIKRTNYGIKKKEETNQNTKVEEKKLLIKEARTPLRSGPGESYYIIQNLRKYDELMLLSIHKEWLKVRVRRTETIGFVHYKDVYTEILNK